MSDEKQIFEHVEFGKIGDAFDVGVEYHANSESIWMQFMNKTTLKVFEQTFNKEDMKKITSNWKSKNVYKMIVDRLSSKEKIQKFVRIFFFADMESATQRSDELMNMENIPQSVSVPKGSNDNNNAGKSCLIFVLHYHSDFNDCNFCLILNEKSLSKQDRISMKLYDLQKENCELKKELNSTKITMNTMQQQITELTRSVQRSTQSVQQLTNKMHSLENGMKNKNRNEMKLEMKTEEIDLNLLNTWVKYHTGGYALPKAHKIGNVVYLKGLIKSGNVCYHHILFAIWMDL